MSMEKDEWRRSSKQDRDTHHADALEGVDGVAKEDGHGGERGQRNGLGGHIAGAVARRLAAGVGRDAVAPHVLADIDWCQGDAAMEKGSE